VVLATDIGLAVGCALLTANALLVRPRVWPLFLAAALMSALNGLQRPSLEAITPRLLSKDELAAAASLQTLRGSTGMIVGPALGGMLIASAGLASTYVVDLLTYAFRSSPCGRSAACRPGGVPRRPAWPGLREGFRYARSRQELIRTTSSNSVPWCSACRRAVPGAVGTCWAAARAGPALHRRPPVGRAGGRASPAPGRRACIGMAWA